MDTASFIISIVSIVFTIGLSVFTFIKTSKISKESNDLSQKNNELTQQGNDLSQKYNDLMNKSVELSKQSTDMLLGQTEIQVFEMINKTKESVMEYSWRLINITDKSKSELFKMVYLSAIENNLNAYNDACAKYVDGKVDKSRFKKLYQRDIRQLCEDDEYKNYLGSDTSPYKSIKTVYNEWEGHN